MEHKKKKDIKLGKSEFFLEDVYNDPQNYKCPKCGGILVATCGLGVRITVCADCNYSATSYY